MPLLFILDYAGGKDMLKERLEKLKNLEETLPEHVGKLDVLDSKVKNSSALLPTHYKESVIKDIANVRLVKTLL